MKILNWTNDHELRQMKRRGWSERSREALPEERRVLVTLYHPRQTLGEGAARHISGAVTFRSLPLDAATQLALFDV